MGCIKSPILNDREYSFQIESVSAEGWSVSLSTRSINVLKTYLLVCFSSKAVNFSKTSSTSTNSLFARRSRKALWISLKRWRALNGRFSVFLPIMSQSDTASASMMAVGGAWPALLQIREYSERIPGLCESIRRELYLSRFSSMSYRTFSINWVSVIRSITPSRPLQTAIRNVSVWERLSVDFRTPHARVRIRRIAISDYIHGFINDYRSYSVSS